jgi:apolipoprotein N-acyltransferase
VWPKDCAFRNHCPLAAAFAVVARLMLYLLGFGKIWGYCGTSLVFVVICRDRLSLITLTWSTALAIAAFPPFHWHFAILVFLGPLFQHWRTRARVQTACLDGFACGFAFAWWAVPMLELALEESGELAQLLGCSVVGLHLAVVALVCHATRNHPSYLAAAAVAVSAAFLEFVRAELLQFPLLLAAQPLAGTPLAQWASYVWIYGVSCGVYFLSCILWPPLQTDRKVAIWGKGGSSVAIALGALFWIGGKAVATQVPDAELPVDLIIVQPSPGGRSAIGFSATRTSALLSELTAAAHRNRAIHRLPDPELIVWPEFSADIDASSLGASQQHAGPLVGLKDRSWKGSMLIGAIISGGGKPCTNSALLIDRTGSWQRYDKMRMIPFAEARPLWTRDFPWEGTLDELFGARQRPFEPGHRYLPLTLDNRRDRDKVRIGVSLCCEIHFATMPQYRRNQPDNLIIHLSNEQWYTDIYSEFCWYATWNVQYRAIETRKWQAVASASAHSALIRPSGDIAVLLGTEPGFIDSRTISGWNGPPQRSSSQSR